MKRITIISAVIGAIALGGTIATAAEQSHRTDYPAMVQLQQNARTEYQNKMREWSAGLGVGLPGAPQLAGSARNPDATTAAAARTRQPCHPANYQSMRHLRLAKETEYQRRMREWSTGLGIKLPGAVSMPDTLAFSTSSTRDCAR